MLKNLTYLLILAFALSSCVKDDVRHACEPERVLLVYVGTDNNLSGYEQEKLQGLRDGWVNGISSGNLSKNDRIIAYIDSQNADARLIEISNLASGEQPRRIGRYGDSDNSASAEVFERVISDVRAMFPNAESFGLLVFSHASGWLPAGALTDPYKAEYTRSNTRSLIIDGSDEMGITDFAAAIPDGMLDYIAFEMCFTAGIEVAYELRNKADYILVSSAEIVHPGYAPVYANATTKLLSGSIESFGQSVFNNVMTYAENSVQHSATFSVIRTAGLEELAKFVKQNCDLSRDVNVSEVQHFDRYNYRLFFDFGDYFGRLLDTDNQRAELDPLIGNCITWKDATPEFMTQSPGNKGFKVNKHSGLTTYIQQPQFAGLNTEYSKLGWVKAISK